MKFSNLFKRRAKAGIIEATPIRGITEDEWQDIYADIKDEYDDTARQHKKPTEYMRGLAYALKVLEATKPYTIAEVR